MKALSCAPDAHFDGFDRNVQVARDNRLRILVQGRSNQRVTQRFRQFGERLPQSPEPLSLYQFRLGMTDVGSLEPMHDIIAKLGKSFASDRSAPGPVPAFVDRNRGQPGLEVAIGIVAAQGAPECQVGFLHYVGYVAGIREARGNQAAHPARMTFAQQREGRLDALQGERDQ